MRLRLAVMQFLQFFAWGAWVITAAAYYIRVLGLSGTEVGALFSLMGFASLVMPGLVGLIGDNWISQERLYALLQAVAGGALLVASVTTTFTGLFWCMLLNAVAFMPTLSLGYALGYATLEDEGWDIVATFPRIRVWGTVGFVAAMWLVSLSGWELRPVQFVIGGVAGLVLSAYSLTLPHCPPRHQRHGGSLWSALGISSFRFFRSGQLGIFFVFAMLLGSLLSVSMTWVDAYLHSFATEFPDSLAVQYPAVLISISQLSEIVFILLIPFFLGRLGIKIVMLMSLIAWVLRFGLLAFGDPGPALWMLIVAMLVYGCAFDFFNIAGSLYVEGQVSESSRASAQGMFMTMVNGAGAVLGGLLGGILIDRNTIGGATDWSHFWLLCSGFAIALAALLAIFFVSPRQRERASTTA